MNYAKYSRMQKIIQEYNQILKEIEEDELLHNSINKPGLYRVEWFIPSTGFSSHGDWVRFETADATCKQCNNKYPYIEHRVVKCSNRYE
jgi:hypothetical protein